jgi:hypothetical protein
MYNKIKVKNSSKCACISFIWGCFNYFLYYLQLHSSFPLSLAFRLPGVGGMSLPFNLPSPISDAP